MTDREKVIKALEVCSSISDGEACPKECPYRGQDIYCSGSAGLMLHALDLLKEQEPMCGKWVNQLSSCPSAIAVGGSRTSACTICGGWGRKTFKYCPHCGAKMEKQEEKADD